MNYYATKKENICIFKAAGEEQRDNSLIRRGKCNKNGTASYKILSALIREFNGEIINNDKMILYSFFEI
ncbi:MAG: hypothetical protein FWF73_05930 [Spirochaetes bacterium]|nr:hypothetical protein [Spirochaetota bacterium]